MQYLMYNVLVASRWSLQSLKITLTSFTQELKPTIDFKLEVSIFRQYSCHLVWNAQINKLFPASRPFLWLKPLTLYHPCLHCHPDTPHWVYSTPQQRMAAGHAHSSVSPHSHTAGITTCETSAATPLSPLCYVSNDRLHLQRASEINIL